MNYFTCVAISSVLTIFLGIQSNGQKTFPGTYNLFKTGDCPKKLDIYRPNTNGEWPAKVGYFKFEAFKNTRISLDIKWAAEIKNVKGFKIVLKPSGKPDICRILDYTKAINSSSFGLFSFAFKFNSIYDNRVFGAELCPLPKLGNSTCVYTQFDTRDCSSFAPIFTYDYDGTNLMVNLTKGPAWCNYKEYSIIVLTQNNSGVIEKRIPTNDNVDKLHVTFPMRVCKGYHKIYASVFDQNFSDTSTCACKNSQNACERCQNTMKDKIYLVPATSCKPDVPDEADEPEQNKLLFPLGIVIGLLFLTVLALYITNWKLSVHLMLKKRGIVLHLDDHEHHTNAVTKLVDYLNEYHLKVSLASAFLKNHDNPGQMVITEVLKSDFILLVLSPALQKRMEAWDKQQDYVEFFKEKNSNILNKLLLEVLLGSNKLHVCKFEHTAEFGSWPNPCYSLPSDLTRMVAALNGQSFSQRLAFCNCLKSNALWGDLLTATKKTIMYEQSHANWFKDKYVCPINVSVSHFMADETSREGRSEYTNPQKLKEIFPDYKDTFISLPEEPIAPPSIYSIPISERLQAINERNL